MRDPEKARQRQRRYREKKHVERFGSGAGDQRGRHGHHATGERHGRWSGARRVTDQGYVAVRVALDHPHAWGPVRLKRFRYAYEHHVVAMEMLGRPLHDNEVVHHRNGQRDDNRPENLEVTTRSSHAREHTSMPGVRDSFGRFNSAPRHLRVREFPT